MTDQDGDLFPQFVLFGDSQIQFSTAILDGFSLNAKLQTGKWHFSRPVSDSDPAAFVGVLSVCSICISC